jgi:hypothetical protein
VVAQKNPLAWVGVVVMLVVLVVLAVLIMPPPFR